MSGAPRSMKMGTILSPCPYDAVADEALQSTNLRRAAISCCLSLRLPEQGRPRFVADCRPGPAAMASASLLPARPRSKLRARDRSRPTYPRARSSAFDRARRGALPPDIIFSFSYDQNVLSQESPALATPARSTAEGITAACTFHCWQAAPTSNLALTRSILLNVAAISGM